METSPTRTRGREHDQQGDESDPYWISLLFNMLK